jgi:hypothetical protein
MDGRYPPRTVRNRAGPSTEKASAVRPTGRQQEHPPTTRRAARRPACTHPSDMPTTHPRARHDDGFPGGRARLPFHYDPQRFSTEADHDVPEVIDDSPEEEPAGGFFDYFSTESLFVGQPEPEQVRAADDPHAVLGLTPSATWAEITQRHRSLMKQFHPDRHVTSDEPTRAHAEQRVRDVNEAVATLREARRG